RDSEVSTAMFFTENAGVWSPLVDAPAFAMQDPFFTFINGELIFGGVEIFPNSQGGYGYRTRFYRGRGLDSLESFAQGPDGMKDIRLVQLPGGKIGLFTRPQGRIAGTGVDAGRGKIGFSVIASLADLTLETINAAPLIENQFHPEEWGGVNEAQILSDGRLVALAHVARFDELGNRHYYSAVFTLDSASRQASPFEIILERSDLTGGLNGESKRKDLMDVVFSGGLELGKNHATVYVGAGDAEVHMKKIDLPNSLRPLPAK
ncbi:MAG: DUF1861 family protein, partial [Bdellovibrionales bacterium]